MEIFNISYINKFFSNSYVSNAKGFFSSDKISKKALSIFAILGTLATVGFFLLRKFSYQPKDTSESSCEKEIIRKVSQEIIETKYLKTAGQKLGTALENEDNFYDALSKALYHQLKIKVSIKELRQDVARSLETSENAEKFQKTLESIPTAKIDNFETYKKYVGYSTEELQQLKNPEAPTIAYPGNPDREGKLLCRKYGFQLVILSVKFNMPQSKTETKISERIMHRVDAYFNHDYYSVTKEEICYSSDEALMKYFSMTDRPISCYSYSKVCTLARIDDHFVPVL